MNLTAVYDWATQPAQNAALKKQLAAAIATAAVQVLAESPTTYNHDQRTVWARGVLATPQAPLDEADQMIWGILGNTTIQGELASGNGVPDDDLKFTVNGLIDTYA